MLLLLISAFTTTDFEIRLMIKLQKEWQQNDSQANKKVHNLLRTLMQAW